jgi:hypothetical protein
VKIISDQCNELESFAQNLEQESSSSLYTSMPSKLFTHFDSLPFDVFIYLDSRYIKYIHANDPIDHSRIMLLLLQSTEDLYFESIHRKLFAKMLLNCLKEQLTIRTNSFYEKSINSSAVHSTLNEIVMAVGFKSKIIDICELALESLQQEVAVINHNGMNKYLKMLKTREFDLKYKHIQLCSYCSVSMVEQLHWPEFKEQSRKLVYASFFSDFALKTPGHLALRKEYDVCNLTGEERFLFEEHPLRATRLLETVPFICSDILKIILQHHGSPTGVGLKNYKHPSLGPMSLVFIAAQEFATKIIFNGHENFRQLIKDLKHEHQETHIKGYLEVLESALEP